MSRLSYTEQEARAAIAASLSWSESLRRLGLCSTGGAWRVLKKHAARWRIDTGHFVPTGRPPARAKPLDELLVEHSPIRGTKLKERLYRTGIKSPICELCGQTETWRGRHMSLILDHINGVRDDNRLDNLRIVCPNCNATLDTHCGRKTRNEPLPVRICLLCEREFAPNFPEQRYCSRYCGSRHPRSGTRSPSRRAVRPPVGHLLEAVRTDGYETTGRRFGVTGNAVRKWIVAAGRTPPPGGGRTRRSSRDEPNGDVIDFPEPPRLSGSGQAA